jgi:glycosyltransferase involved in cell wall biosynthesis
LGEGEERRVIEARIRDRGLAGRFVLAGFRVDVDALLPVFDVFCLSSHMEGLGTSVLDAMMFGVAVVATAAGGIPEAVEDGVTGRSVPPRRADLLAEALVEMLSDAPRRSALAAAGRRRYEERFRVEAMVDETLRVYEERTCASARS